MSVWASVTVMLGEAFGHNGLSITATPEQGGRQKGLQISKMSV